MDLQFNQWSTAMQRMVLRFRLRVGVRGCATVLLFSRFGLGTSPATVDSTRQGLFQQGRCTAQDSYQQAL